MTTLFWGAGATLRLIVLELGRRWRLKFDLEKATQLTAVTAVGIAIGSVLAATLRVAATRGARCCRWAS